MVFFNHRNFSLPGARAGNRRQSRSRSPLRRSSVKANRNGEYRMKMRGMPYTIVEKDAIQVGDGHRWKAAEHMSFVELVLPVLLSTGTY